MSVYMETAAFGYKVGVRDVRGNGILEVQFLDYGTAAGVTAAFTAAKAYENRLKQVVLTYN